MKNRTLSMIGFFIDSLHIKTVSMAAALHVDASLISKWKNGKRILTDKSMYFDDVIAYFLEQNRNLADDLTRHPNMRVAFVSETDGIALPAINCCCIHGIGGMSVKDSTGEKRSAIRANIFAGARGGAGAVTVP